MTIEVHDQNIAVLEGLFADLVTIPVDPLNPATPAIGARYYARDTGQSFELRPGLTLTDFRLWVEIGQTSGGVLTIIGELRVSSTSTVGPIEPQVANTIAGRSVIRAGSNSGTVQNSLVNPASHVFAIISQAVADATLTTITRAVAGTGSFTVYGNGVALATADVQYDWIVVNPPPP